MVVLGGKHLFAVDILRRPAGWPEVDQFHGATALPVMRSGSGWVGLA